MKESDVATFTISAVDDPRTLNKVVYLRPPGNVYSVNELIEIWESKIGKKLEKIYEPEEELLKKIKGILLVFKKLLCAQVAANCQLEDFQVAPKLLKRGEKWKNKRRKFLKKK